MFSLKGDRLLPLLLHLPQPGRHPSCFLQAKALPKEEERLGFVCCGVSFAVGYGEGSAVLLWGPWLLVCPGGGQGV